ncbi:MAG TPA: DUF2089 domain-containing protein [Thermaerobacter sp.]
MRARSFEVPARCPNCGHGLEVREVVCAACGTQIRAPYRLSPFDLLEPEQRRFALLFLRAAGNLREMERLLGVSYPTVRKKLDEIIAALGGPVSASEPGAGSSGREMSAGETPTGGPAGAYPAATGGPPPVGPVLGPAGTRRAILDRVRRGELTVDEALVLLGRLGSGGRTGPQDRERPSDGRSGGENGPDGGRDGSHGPDGGTNGDAVARPEEGKR